jgi:hypothetical protein
LTSLADVIVEAEKRLERGLTEDEVVLVGRMIELEKGEDEILELLGEKVVIPTDEELQTIRYEASGASGVMPIPPPPEEGEG